MLKREQNSLIIFMGSYADLIPTPLNSVYGATKAFINSLSQTIKYETKESRVDISLIRPLYVRTRLSSFLPPTHFMLVSVEDFVKSAIKEIEKGNFMTNGHWKHRIIAKLIEHNDFLTFIF